MPIVTYKGVAPMIAAMQAAMATGVVQSAESFVGKAMAATPVETGTLRASIHVEDVNVGANEVTAKVSTGGESSEYALFVHEGTGPHKITGNPFLAFNGIVVRSVNHPGTTAYKFMERPLIEHRPVHAAIIAAAAAGAF